MSASYSALVIDDEPLARHRLVRMLRKLNWIESIAEAADIHEGIRQATESQPDILLLDIQMPGGNGFELLEKLGSSPPIVIFVTAFSHYAVKAFDANAIDYLTKPIEPGRFNLAMERARVAAGNQHQSDKITELQATLATLKTALDQQPGPCQDIWAKSRDGYSRITINEIIRVQAERDYVRIYLPTGEHLYHENLTRMETLLQAHGFMRIHRGSIVNLKKIVRIKKGALSSTLLVLSDGAELRVGRTYLDKLREVILKA